MRPGKGSKLLRKGRHSIANQAYLLTTSTVNRERIFLNPEAAQVVLTSLDWMNRQDRVTLVAAVVMPDHVHFAASLKSTDLPQLMHSFKSYTSNRINAVLRRRGPLWQNGYHDHAVRREEDLNEAVLYVLNNPVREGLVKDFRSYPFWYCRWEV